MIVKDSRGITEKLRDDRDGFDGFSFAVEGNFLFGSEFNGAGRGGVKRVVIAPADAQAGVELGAALADDDSTGHDFFAVKKLHA